MLRHRSSYLYDVVTMKMGAEALRSQVPCLQLHSWGVTGLGHTCFPPFQLQLLTSSDLAVPVTAPVLCVAFPALHKVINLLKIISVADGFLMEHAAPGPSLEV